MTTEAQSGHPSSSLSAVELMVGLLFGGVFRFDVTHPNDPHNDRLIFSKGHASPLFYALWVAAGAIQPSQLRAYRSFSSSLEGHPTRRFAFTELPTGSLGQGLSMGVGMALQARLTRARYRTFVLLGDSEMAEGANWEAIQLAAHYHLDSLIGIIDINRLGQRGETMYGHRLVEYERRIRAFGWHTMSVDGHDLRAVRRTFAQLKQGTGRPTMILAKTVKGKGVAFLENKNNWHGKALYPQQFADLLPSFAQLDQSVRGKILMPKKSKTHRPLKKVLHKQLTKQKIDSVREALGVAAAQLGTVFPELVVLDAEVSNSTKMNYFQKAFPDRFFEMFIAEQNMVGVALGMARRGLHPIVSTFGAFLLRAADQIRMSQYAKVPIMYIGSHPGVTIGKDGYSQMALEDIAFFRSLRTSVVLYPADAPSAQKLLREGLKEKGIVYIRSTRNATPQLYRSSDRFVVGGSHTLRRSKRDRVSIVSAGITLHQALAAADALKADGIFVRIIDAYSIKPLDVATLRRALGETRGMVVVEDHYQAGGIGEAVRSELYGSVKPIISLCVRQEPRSGKPDQLLAYEKIGKHAIMQAVKRILK